MPSLFLLTIDVGRQDFTTCLSVSLPSSTRDRPRRPINLPGGLSATNRHYQRQGLRKRRYLVPITIGHGHKSPRASDSMYSSATIHPIVV
jgi:hypothetical protein